jgi:hypothetical protein
LLVFAASDDALLHVPNNILCVALQTVTIDVLSGAFGGQDSDLDLDELTVKAIVGQPSHGSVVINADNTITYTPVSGYGGPDSVVYEITDGRDGFASATVNLFVSSNSPPTARDDATTININEPGEQHE